ncbi:MAG: TrmB family transcriptional regulator [Candidatus Hodarchaeota archaeon]
MVVDEELLLNDLQTLGLTKNEGKALITLIKIGSSTEATKIANISSIPRSKIYQVLEGLETKKIVTMEEIKRSANRYRLALNPAQLIPFLQNNLVQPIEKAAERSANNLMTISNTLQEEEGIHEAWIIKGQYHVMQIMKEMIDSATNMIISNMFPYYLEPIVSNLKHAKNRGLQIRLIMLDEEFDQLANSVNTDSLSEDVTGINLEKLLDSIEKIPLKGEFKNFRTLLILFHELLGERPNILLVDPDSDHTTAIFLVGPKSDPVNITAIQIQNIDFINFVVKLIELIFNFATTIRLLQDQFN